jgi:hypothetical protein
VTSTLQSLVEPLSGAPVLAPAIAASLLVSVKHWLAPVRTRLAYRAPAQAAELRAIPANFVTPPELADPIDALAASLRALGFRATAILRDPQHERALVRLFEGPGAAHVATVIAVGRDAGSPTVVLGFTSRCADGARVYTGNSAVGSVFPVRPGVRSARFPSERDPRRLYALHRVHVRRAPRAIVPVLVGDPAEYQRHEEEAALRWMIDSGYMYRDGAAIRPTWKGACLMPWRLLFPWRQLSERRDEALRRSLLAEAGLT